MLSAVRFLLPPTGSSRGLVKLVAHESSCSLLILTLNSLLTSTGLYFWLSPFLPSALQSGPRCVFVLRERGRTGAVKYLSTRLHIQFRLETHVTDGHLCECVKERESDSEHIRMCACMLFFCFPVVFHVNCVWWPCGRRRHPSK